MRKTIVRIFISILIFLGLDLLLGIFLIPDNFNAFRTKHYYYHHGLLPNQERMAAWGALFYPVQTNSLGLIDSAAYKLQAQTKNRRLLILGDSHSEGVGVPYLKTFAGRLARSLDPKGIEVINGSAVSYSQKIEYLKAKYLIEQKGLDVDEILVLIDISDLQNELVYEAFDPDEKSALGDMLFSMKSKLKHLSSIWYLADAIRSDREREQFFKSIDTFYKDVRDNPNNNIWELYSGFFSHFENEVLLSNPQFHGMADWLENDDFRELALRGIGLGQHHMVQLKELCDRHDIHLSLSVHPWHHQIETGNVNDEYVQLWKSFAESQEISFINFFPLFINGENPGLVIRKYYIKNDNHWNEFGHEQVASYLNDYYSERYFSDN